MLAGDRKEAGKPEREEMPAKERKEFKLALFHICFFLSAGALFMLLSFLVPMSRRLQYQCWQTAAVAFFSAAVITKRHPVVLAPVIRRWSGQQN
ncbi:unnamed protein product [Urochloa decumbens]|uniref:Uncharacterized protein n=1 Tax=Urochloa decumbens TaxID=240449 RepID=A0ABC9FWA7_9POAL